MPPYMDFPAIKAFEERIAEQAAEANRSYEDFDEMFEESYFLASDEDLEMPETPENSLSPDYPLTQYEDLTNDLDLDEFFDTSHLNPYNFNAEEFFDLSDLPEFPLE